VARVLLHRAPEFLSRFLEGIFHRLTFQAVLLS
jgi:hypothetical protein